MSKPHTSKKAAHKTAKPAHEPKAEREGPTGDLGEVRDNSEMEAGDGGLKANRSRYFRVKQDITIKAGTVLQKDGSTHTSIDGAFVTLETSKDSCANFIIDDDVLADRQDLFEEIESPGAAHLISRILPSLEA